jgi:kexin
MFARRLHRMPLALVGLAALLLAACSGSNSDTDDSFNPADCYYTYTVTDSTQLVGLDPLLTKQWHLENIGQSDGTWGEDIRAQAAWIEFGVRGEGIRVAVVDDAVETVHHDLAPNLVPGAVWDYRSGTATAPLPCDADDDHGTAVTGIVLARDANLFGGAGVAPRASLAAYNALATSTDADIADALNRDLAGNAIYNNSWGSTDNGMLNRAEASFVTAIRYGIANGRNGKGAIYVFPGGNGGCFLVDRDGQCAFDDNSNYDGYVNQLGVIAACAVDDDGRAPLYAEPGANLLVCGPSGNAETAITTTDVENGFRSDFSGTSASTPMVSGAAALILSANPELTWRDVRLILANSARQNDPLDPGWIPGTDGRRPFNPLYGFGAADAQAAVALAKTWQTVGDWESLRSCGPYIGGSGVAPFPIDVPDAPESGEPQTREHTISIAGCEIGKIEFVEIRFSADAEYSGDLRVDLVSPNNLVSRLADARLCDPNEDEIADNCGDYDNWAFGSVRHLDEAVNGQWTLTVSDRLFDGLVNQRPVAPSRWTGWSILFWGRP